MPTSDNDDVSRLANLAAALTVEVNDLADGTKSNVAELGRQTVKTRKVMWGLAASIAIDLALTAVLTLGLVQVNTNQNDINQLTDRLDNAQSVQRQKGLCPLYALFYDLTDTKEERAAGRAQSKDPKQYDQQIKVIQKGYENLKCAEFKGSAPGLKR